MQFLVWVTSSPAFNSFFPESMEEIILDMTSPERKHVFRDMWRALDLVDLQAYMDLLIPAGIKCICFVDGDRPSLEPGKCFKRRLFLAELGKAFSGDNTFLAHQPLSVWLGVCKHPAAVPQQGLWINIIIFSVCSLYIHSSYKCSH